MSHFSLPAADWLDSFYAPIEARLEKLRAKYSGRSEALAVVEDFQEEIDMYRRYGEYYGYVFFIAQK